MSLPHEAATELFRGRHFNHEIITLCVRWYVTYKLSYRDLVEMMAERHVNLAHTTIMRWVQREHQGVGEVGNDVDGKNHNTFPLSWTKRSASPRVLDAL